MKLLTASAFSLSLIASGAMAETHMTAPATDAAQAVDNAATATVNTVDNAATATANALGGTAAYTTDQLGSMQGQLIRSRDITGGKVMTMNEANDEGWNAGYTAVGADWNEIGEIEDLVLSRDGQLIGVVAEVGGFLDIGDKHVMISLGDVRLVPVDDRSFVLVTRLSEEQLEALPGVDEGFWN